MTQYRLCPGGEVDHWVLEHWVEPRKGWIFTHPGYWSYERCLASNEIEAFKAHIAQPVQYFSGSP